MRTVAGSHQIGASAAVWLAMFCALARGGEPPAAGPATAPLQNPSLRKELLVRVGRDQAVRKKLIDRAKEKGLDIGSQEFLAQAETLLKELQEVDDDNRRWFKGVVDRHGWPGRSLAGAKGAEAAFLLAQHANRDLSFQNRCLQLMEQAPAGEVEPANVAYLTDRVRLAEGKGQLYGTQVEFKDGQWRPQKVDEPAKLDERRKAAGLPSMELYLQQVREFYGMPRPATSSSR